LELERAADFRSEYLDGEIFAMGGASPRHVLIVTNVAGELRSQLRDQPCTVYSTDLRVQVSRDGLYTYPDVVVICGRPTYSDDQRDMVTNPQVIVEVLSKSTKNYDRGEKFEQYRKMESFVEYLLIAQDRTHVEHYIRQADGTWLLSETDDPATTIELASVVCRLPLAEIYAKVDEIDE
jgi:Uma2 family endonuclease